MRYGILAMAILALATASGGVAMADDNAKAQQIAAALRDSGRLKDYNIRVKYQDGTAVLSGRVTSREQQSAALSVARQDPSVNNVVNKMTVGGPAAGMRSLLFGSRDREDGGVAPASHEANYGPTGGPMPPGAIPVGTEMSGAVMGGRGGPMHGGPMPHGPMPGGMMPVSSAMGGGGPVPEYVPGAPGPLAPVPAARYDEPYFPNYAWPAYASYPNYAALTYPQQYSPTAWPYIGPFYPYPQVPLGWRKASLEWDDGWWMLSFKQKSKWCR